jgi:outer membrane protein assembly factor BamB
MKFQSNGIRDNYRFMNSLFAICIALVIIAASVAAQRRQSGAQSKAQSATRSSWLQWGGPSRDFKVAAQGIKESWPSGAPRQLWSRALGEGHSAILVEEGRLYTMYSSGDREVIISLEAATGKTVWEFPYEVDTKGLDLSRGKGPHSTPLIAGGLIYAVGVKGMVHALDKNNGRMVWKHDLWSEYGKHFDGSGGYSPSPVAYRSTVIVPVGGRSGQCLMAFDQQTGAVVWKNIDFTPAPASPIIINVGGQDQIVHFGETEVYGADASNGNLLWSHPQDRFSISTPVWDPSDGLLFMSTVYGAGGSRVIRLARSGERTTATQVWANNRVRIHFVNAVRVGDIIYGSSGELGPAFFTAVNVKDGKVAWQDRALSLASFLYADNKFVILDEDGELAIASPGQNGLRIRAKAPVMKNLAWTVPTLSGTRLYLRDRGMIMALDLG